MLSTFDPILIVLLGFILLCRWAVGLVDHALTGDFVSPIYTRAAIALELYLDTTAAVLLAWRSRTSLLGCSREAINHLRTVVTTLCHVVTANHSGIKRFTRLSQTAKPSNTADRVAVTAWNSICHSLLTLASNNGLERQDQSSQEGQPPLQEESDDFMSSLDSLTDLLLDAFAGVPCYAPAIAKLQDLKNICAPATNILSIDDRSMARESQ